jgi:hypothetical protein
LVVECRFKGEEIHADAVLDLYERGIVTRECLNTVLSQTYGLPLSAFTQPTMEEANQDAEFKAGKASKKSSTKAAKNKKRKRTGDVGAGSGSDVEADAGLFEERKEKGATGDAGLFSD